MLWGKSRRHTLDRKLGVFWTSSDRVANQTRSPSPKTCRSNDSDIMAPARNEYGSVPHSPVITSIYVLFLCR
jgi:hypothetical protein